MNRRPDPAPGAFVLAVPWELEHPGGVNQVVMNLYDQLERAVPGLPTVLVKSWAHPRMERGEVGGRRTLRRRFRDPLPGRNAMKAGLLFWANLPRELMRLRRWLGEARVAVVNAHYPGLWLLPLAALRRFGGRPSCLILSVHGQDIRSACAWTGLRRRLWLWLLDSADHIVACSDALAGEVREAFPAVADRVEAVPNGIDAEALQDRARPPAAVTGLLARGREYLACVATFEHKKGQDVLLKAFAEIAGDWSGVDLVLAGRKAAELPALRRQAQDLGIAERVVFLPDLNHADALGVIAGARVFVLPSRYEPFGIVLLEAGLEGKPVVASRVGGIPEIISDGQYGRLVAPEDAAALVEAISGLLRDPEAAGGLGEALRRRVMEGFTWRRAAQRYRELAGMTPVADPVGRS